MAKLLSEADKDFIWSTSANTIKVMTDFKVLPTPKNYHLWYTYSAKSDVNLNKVVDGMASKNMSFNEEISEKLYEKFFSAEKELKAVIETGATFQQELKKIVSVLKEAGDNSSLHTKDLMDHMGALSDFEGSEELKDIIQVVINDTDKMREQSQKLETKLEESTFKIERLQDNLDNARMESRTDALTNIGNRKFFEEKLSEYINNHEKIGHDLCLILCDIDFFKKFNDSYGHQIGDQVLKVVAHVVKTELGSDGAAARYGGEEFAILLPKKKLGEALDLAERIRSVISKRIIKNKQTGANFGKITMSFGVASYDNCPSGEALIENADAALYLAKDNGRNRVQSELDTAAAGQQTA
ncbi:GGDEF domain-containing protein [Pseudemcibacter aquimaris]|uniref:GGDEF domain-containing protein n=1 Tax=Pseudemcibacter aquimaris TaxID=2857064 RepID=UPI002011FE24|nr:GGDEF domain-containing protein [Pseudemcibacter aquimaris]MCC3861115.1 GGDEF domain-containing protein [Pseudemcibacter aquimaris]WDU59933.1 GGDEF domain-containing protein [Pseudemcibacter aquimaris]